MVSLNSAIEIFKKNEPDFKILFVVDALSKTGSGYYIFNAIPKSMQPSDGYADSTVRRVNKDTGKYEAIHFSDDDSFPVKTYNVTA